MNRPADIEIRFNEDGTAHVIDRTLTGEYNHNTASYSLSRSAVDELLKMDGVLDTAQATDPNREEWYEPRANEEEPA